MLAEKLQLLLDAHDRAGSPLRAHLKPGLASDQVASALLAFGLTPPQDLLELFSWANGVDQASWASGSPGVPVLDIAPYVTMPSLEEAIRQYQELMLGASTLERDWPATSDEDEYWRREWFPVLDGGYDKLAVVCDEVDHRVLKRCLAGGMNASYQDLGELVDLATARLSAGIYFWDASERALRRTDGAAAI